MADDLLDQLGPDIARSLRSTMETVSWPAGTIVYSAGDLVQQVYFPSRGLLSLVACTQSGEECHVALVGREGLVGASLILHEHVTPYDIVVQIPVEAHRMAAPQFVATVRRQPRLQRAVELYLQRHMTHIAQWAVCRRHHTDRQRVCGFLLACAQALKADTVPLTQERIASILGCRRHTVSALEVVLQDRALIRQRYGRTRILNRRALESWACDCATEAACGQRRLTDATTRAAGGPLRHSVG